MEAVQGAGQIIKGFFSNLKVTGRKAGLLVDLSVHTCDVVKAFITEFKSLDLQTFYLGFSLAKEAHVEMEIMN